LLETKCFSNECEVIIDTKLRLNECEVLLVDEQINTNQDLSKKEKQMNNTRLTNNKDVSFWLRSYKGKVLILATILDFLFRNRRIGPLQFHWAFRPIDIRIERSIWGAHHTFHMSFAIPGFGFINPHNIYQWVFRLGWLDIQRFKVAEMIKPRTASCIACKGSGEDPKEVLYGNSDCIECKGTGTIPSLHWKRWY
jgi:hypothetical protein